MVSPAVRRSHEAGGTLLFLEETPQWNVDPCDSEGDLFAALRQTPLLITFIFVGAQQCLVSVCFPRVLCCIFAALPSSSQMTNLSFPLFSQASPIPHRVSDSLPEVCQGLYTFETVCSCGALLHAHMPHAGGAVPDHTVLHLMVLSRTRRTGPQSTSITSLYFLSGVFHSGFVAWRQ